MFVLIKGKKTRVEVGSGILSVCIESIILFSLC